MNISDFKNHKEYQKIIKKEKIPIGNFSYEIYLGSDILFRKKMILVFGISQFIRDWKEHLLKD
ncbi:hypothetical protein [Cellulophaga baltica]|uniref:hypothetical protein n=1 Tax=Cellulophaga baltica TaxID=76594 RepID=UPI0015F76D05|nr:hypothetical protein [Cellulophaga baltica]MBA6316926.1 hypothetical protein [Cellulophaga baltica]